ncbi:hypothetical protein ACFE04_007698 [Oxalis oulophora]
MAESLQRSSRIIAAMHNGNPPYGKWIKANSGAHVLGKGQSEGKNQGNGDDMEDSRTHATDFEEEAENQEESNSNLNFPPKVQLAMHADVDNLPHTRDSKKDKPLSLGPGPQQIILRPDSSKNEWITTMSSNQGLEAQVIRSSWNINEAWDTNIRNIQIALQNWSRAEFGILHKSIDKNQKGIQALLKEADPRRNFPEIRSDPAKIQVIFESAFKDTFSSADPLELDIEKVTCLIPKKVSDECGFSVPLGVRPRNVFQLMETPVRQWNEHLINNIFKADVALAIKSIPLVQGDVKDQWVWKETSSGVYSVKSGYQIACKILYHSAPSIWRSLNLADVISYNGISFFEWLNFCFTSLSSSQLQLFFTTCWWIWRNRNKVIFENMYELIPNAVKNLLRWFSFQNLLARSKNQIPIICLRSEVLWKPPGEGLCKINCDATFIKSGNFSHFGIVARNFKGEIIRACCGTSGLVESILHAETGAVWQAVSLALRLGFP